MRVPWIAIQRNPISGARSSRREVLDLIRHLRLRGLRPRIFTDRQLMADYVARPDRREHLIGIVAVGGDGTVRNVAERFPGIPIAILPSGTENLLARYCGIPRCGRRVAEMIAAGATRRLDVGSVGTRRFILMASCGIDADVVHQTHACRNGHIRRWNYFQPLLSSLRNYQYPELRVTAENSSTVLRGRFVMIANLPQYALGLRFAGEARGDDGLLDLRLFRYGSAFQNLRYLYNVAIGRHGKLADVHSLQAFRFRVEADVPVPIQADGDPAGWTPAEFTVFPGGLEIFTSGPESTLSTFPMSSSHQD